MTTSISTDPLITSLQHRIHHQLQHYLPSPQQSPTRLHQAMHYAVFNGGKRIRPLLVYATGLCFQPDLIKLDTAAVAIELIHCYSLIHDDLPAMDDDDYRRGKLSCHKAFDEATAILAGDALQSLAFQLLAQSHPELTPSQQTKMLATLAKASGSLGMAGGQQLDLAAKNQKLSAAQLQQIHSLKTGALFHASIQLAILAITAENMNNQWDELAHHIGLAFQLQDDYFDQDGAAHLTSASHANDLFDQAKNILSTLTVDATPLINIIDYLKTRTI